MKILVLTSHYPPFGAGGHDSRCQQVVEALAGRGHRIQVLTSNYRLPPLGVSGDAGVFRELVLHEDDQADTQVGIAYKATLTHEATNARAVGWRIRRFGPDVVYVWDQARFPKSILFNIRDRGIPTVFDLHGDWLSEASFHRDPWFRWWRRNASLRSKAGRLLLHLTGIAGRRLRAHPLGNSGDLDLSNAYVCSDHLRRQLLEAGVAQAEGIPVIHPALDTGRLLGKVDFSQQKRFMWAGRLSEGKAPELALEAVELLRAQGVRVWLDIFGIGEPLERKTMRCRIDASTVADSVRMKGIRPGELCAHYSRYDAFLYTSRHGDPFPITPLEAMLSRLPCILSDIGGIREIAADGRNALLYAAGDASALARAMRQFLALPDHGHAMAVECIEGLRARHSLDKMSPVIESILSRAAQTPGVPLTHTTLCLQNV